MLLCSSVAVMAADCDPGGFFLVANESSGTIAYQVESRFSPGEFIGTTEIEPGDDAIFRTGEPCSGVPSLITDAEGETIATYEPDEGCDLSSAWIIRDDGDELISQDEYYSP